MATEDKFRTRRTFLKGSTIRSVLPFPSLFQVICLTLVILILTSCSSVVKYNLPATEVGNTPPPLGATHPKDVVIFIALSGGGLRAAAFSYGVLDELQNLGIMDKVSYISGVSGGAFTAAYYAVIKDPPSELSKFKDKFLYVNNEANLLSRFILPLTLADLSSRSYVAGDYYQRMLFDDKTFGDLRSKPFLIINATDLVTGRRFTFTQEQFRCLQSDLAHYPLGYAVAASSAFPVFFSSIQLKNFMERPSPCFNDQDYEILSSKDKGETRSNIAPQRDPTQSSEPLDLVLRQRYLDHTNTSYLQLSDGGISDNLGIQAFRDLIPQLLRDISNRSITGIVLISVNAATNPHNAFGTIPSSPNFIEVVTRANELLLQRATTSSQEEVAKEIKEMESYIEATNRQIQFVCMNISFTDIDDDSLRLSLNEIPTRLSLAREQVDTLISAGRFLLRKKSEALNAIQKLIKNPSDFVSTPSAHCELTPQF